MVAWQYFLDFITIAPQKKAEKPKSQVKILNKQYQQKLANSVKSLGFKSKKIDNFQLQDPNFNLVSNFFYRV